MVLFFSVSLIGNALSENNFYLKAKKNYEEKKYDESKFLFQRNIVFNPKDENSYLYLAKIYNFEENEEEKEKNINTVLLLNPINEEAIYILMEIELKKSNYLRVRELVESFTKICIKLCNNKDLILESLKNIEPKNES
jgi:tetratricopeptide (TPR) repeat protein